MRYFARVLIPADKEVELAEGRVREFFEGVRALAAPKGPLALQTRVLATDRYLKGESFSVPDHAIARALEEPDGDLGQKLLVTRGSAFARALSLDVDARAIVCVSFRAREVSLSDPHEDVTSKATRLPYGTICRKPVDVGVFRDPDSRDSIEVPGAGSGRVWISIAVFDGPGPLPAVGAALVTPARALIGVFTEGTHWVD